MKIVARLDRRLLVNWRVDPSAIRAVLPDGLRLELVDGDAVAGICVLRVSGVRPAATRLPDPLPVVSAAHRIAVEWDDALGRHRGVWVAARHTRSPFAAVLGGRVVPGVQRLARIQWERDPVESVALAAGDRSASFRLAPIGTPQGALFAGLDVAAAFFGESADVAWSADRRGVLEPLRMRSRGARFEALAASDVTSSWIDSLGTGAAAFDSAFVMRDAALQWDRPPLASPTATAPAH